MMATFGELLVCPYSTNLYALLVLFVVHGRMVGGPWHRGKDGF